MVMVVSIQKTSKLGQPVVFKSLRVDNWYIFRYSRESVKWSCKLMNTCAHLGVQIKNVSLTFFPWIKLGIVELIVDFTMVLSR